MPIVAPTRQAPAHTPVPQSTHGIVPFNRRGSRSSNDKKLNNGGGNGRKPPLGGSGKGGGDHKRYCRELIDGFYNGFVKDEKNSMFENILFLKRAFLHVFDKILTLSKKINWAEKSIIFFTLEKNNKMVKTWTTKKLALTTEIKPLLKDYKDSVSTLSNRLNTILTSCKSFLTSKELSELTEFQDWLEENAGLIDKAEMQVNSILKGNYKIQLTPLNLIKPKIKLAVQASPLDILSNNMLNYANQAFNLPDKVSRKINNFFEQKPQTPAQFDVQMRQEQEDEIKRRKKAANNESVAKLFPYLPVFMRYAPLLGL